MNQMLITSLKTEPIRAYKDLLELLKMHFKGAKADYDLLAVPCDRLDTRTVELTHISFTMLPKIANTIPQWNHKWFNNYYSARLAYILEVPNNKAKLEEVEALLKRDPNTRRAYILNLDFYWEGHDPCNMIYHFLHRNGLLDLIIYLRSSDLVNVLPVDVATACCLLHRMVKKIESGVGTITFVVGSAHVYEKDWVDFFGTWPLKTSKGGS